MTLDNGQMIIKHYKTGSMDWLEPETHKLVFKHCNHGESTVSQKDFEKNVRPMLFIHGIKEIKII